MMIASNMGVFLTLTNNLNGLIHFNGIYYVESLEII